MSNDNVFKLVQPGAFDDQLTEILRQGARPRLAQAAEAEVADFLAKHAGLKTEDGRQRIVRHGYLPEREVMTGIGPVAVRQPRTAQTRQAGNLQLPGFYLHLRNIPPGSLPDQTEVPERPHAGKAPGDSSRNCVSGCTSRSASRGIGSNRSSTSF